MTNAEQWARSNETPLVPVSWGEVFDKFTILRLKKRKLVDLEKINNVIRELEQLEAVIGDVTLIPSDVTVELVQLSQVNEELWDIEDHLRDKERLQSFDQEFVSLARSVYFKNDARARIKRKINELLGSPLTEEKSYTSYSADESF